MNTITSQNTPLKIIYGTRESSRWGTIYECRGLISNKICAISKDLFILIKNIGLEQQNLDYIPFSNQMAYSNAGTESNTEDEILDAILNESSYSPSETLEEFIQRINNHVKIELTNNLDEEEKPCFLLSDFSNDNALDFTLEKGESKVLVISLYEKRKSKNIKVGFTITNNGQKILDTLLKPVSGHYASSNKTKEYTCIGNNSHYILPNRTILNFNVFHTKKNNNSISIANHSPSVSHVQLEEAINIAQVPRPHLQRGSSPQMPQNNLIDKRDVNPSPQARTLVGRFSVQKVIMNTAQNTMTMNPPLKISYGTIENKQRDIHECRGLISNAICVISKKLFILIKNIGLEQQNLDNIPLSNQMLYPNSETQSDREEELFGGILRERSHHPTESREHVKIEFTNNLDEEKNPYFLLSDFSNGNAFDFILEKGESKRLALSFNKKVAKRKVGFTITNNGQKILDTLLKKASKGFASINKTKEYTSMGSNSHYILPNRTILDFNVFYTKKNKNSTSSAIHSSSVADIPLQEARNMAQGSVTFFPLFPRVNFPQMSQINLKESPQTAALSYCSQETVSSRHIQGMQPVLELRNFNIPNPLFFGNIPNIYAEEVFNDKIITATGSVYRKIDKRDFNPYPQSRTLAGRSIAQNTIASSRIASAEKEQLNLPML